MSRNDALYQEITDRILETMEAGTIPWHKPWSTNGMQLQAVDGRPYRGVNVWLLHMTAMSRGYTDPRWVTFNKAKKSGGMVKKGQNKANGLGSTRIVFYKPIKKEASDGTVSSFCMMKTYNVFNVEQIDWEEGALKALDVVDNDNDPIEMCDAVVTDMPHPPELKQGADGRCWYSPSKDLISMTPINKFDNSEAYYGTLFHELAHATGHKKRIGRLDNSPLMAFGSEDYGKEELVAELASALVCGVVGIETAKPENAAAYLQNWMKTIKADKSMFLSAAQQAQRSADWILNQRQDRDC